MIRRAESLINLKTYQGFVGGKVSENTSDHAINVTTLATHAVIGGRRRLCCVHLQISNFLF